MRARTSMPSSTSRAASTGALVAMIPRRLAGALHRLARALRRMIALFPLHAPSAQRQRSKAKPKRCASCVASSMGAPPQE